MDDNLGFVIQCNPHAKCESASVNFKACLKGNTSGGVDSMGEMGGQGRAGQGRAGQGRAGQGRAR